MIAGRVKPIPAFCSIVIKYMRYIVLPDTALPVCGTELKKADRDAENINCEERK